MAQVEPDTEVLEFAISKELHARNFYLALAELVQDQQVVGLLRELADEELEHKAKLEMEFFKNGLVIDTTIKDKLIDTFDYVVSDTPTIDMDYKGLLEMCIQKEDASFRFYVNLLPYAHDKNSRETLLAIIEEEIKHKYRFQMEYENLLKQS